MKIYVCKSSGLCDGAQQAVDAAFDNLDNSLYMYGEIIHNPLVNQQLEKGGAKIISEIDEVLKLENKDKIKILIRAHGVPENIIAKLEDENITYIDKTCPNVKKIHDIVYNMSHQGYKIIIVGNKMHPEIVGTIGWCIEEPLILRDLEEAEEKIPLLDDEDNWYCIVAQTTYNVREYDKIVKLCKEYLTKVECFDTICLDTENRQKEIRDFAQKADAIIVVGGRNSSNTNKLYNIAREKCSNVQLIERCEELVIPELEEQSFVVVIGGASTPQYIIDKIVDSLSSA